MYIVIYLILQYGITLLVGMFMEFASYKDRMNDFSLSDSFSNNAYHPLRNIITFIGDKNPLFILLSVGLIIGMIVLIVKQSIQMKSSELEYDSKGTHGIPLPSRLPGKTPYFRAFLPYNNQNNRKIKEKYK